MHLACANGQLDIVTILVSALINMGYQESLVEKDEQGFIPIHRCCALLLQTKWNESLDLCCRATVFDRSDVVEHLLVEGGDIEAVTEDGMTLIVLAAQHGADKTATLLLKRGADPNSRTSDGSTVLHKAVGNARTLKTIMEVHHVQILCFYVRMYLS